MTMKTPNSPKEYVQNFIETLKTVIEELRQSKDNNIILEKGALLEGKTGKYIYRFNTDQPLSHMDNALYKLIIDSTFMECDFVAAENNQIVLVTAGQVPVDQKITLYIDRTSLPEKLLQCFRDTLEIAETRYAAATRLFNGQFQKSSGNAPDLSAYARLNSYQKAAVVRSIQGDTVI